MAEYIEREAALAAIRKRCAPCGEGIEVLKSVPACNASSTPCSKCWYGGKHLDAPPCNTCPAYPKGGEIDSVNPLTLGEATNKEDEDDG